MWMSLENTRLLEYLPKIILPAFWATMQMLLLSLIFGLVLGVVTAVALVLTAPQGLAPRPRIYMTLNFIVNLIRSFPVIILIVAITPLTKVIIGTTVGWQAAVVPLTIAAFPVIARMVENALLEVNRNVIAAAQSFGASNLQIVRKVMFVEALPSVASGITFSAIQFLGSTTLAGAVGAGGLGAVALTFGYQRFDDVMMYAIVVIFCILVLVIQHCGQRIYRKLK